MQRKYLKYFNRGAYAYIKFVSEHALIVAEMEMKTVIDPPMVVCIMDSALVTIAKVVEAAAG